MLGQVSFCKGIEVGGSSNAPILAARDVNVPNATSPPTESPADVPNFIFEIYFFGRIAFTRDASDTLDAEYNQPII